MREWRGWVPVARLGDERVFAFLRFCVFVFCAGARTRFILHFLSSRH
jgi:hypothetical protein